MYYLLLLFSILIAQTHGAEWPKSETNTYQVIGEVELGVLVPIPDFQLRDSFRFRDLRVWLRSYEHLQDPNKRFTLIFEHLPAEFTLETFAKCCLVNDNFMDMPNFLDKANVIRRVSIMGGVEKNLPMYRFISQYEDLIIEHLFFKVKDNGYCILIAYPAQEEKVQSLYWDSFVNNILPCIELID